MTSKIKLSDEMTDPCIKNEKHQEAYILIVRLECNFGDGTHIAQSLDAMHTE